MFSLKDKWRQILLSTTIVVLLAFMFVGGSNSSAAPPQQAVITPTPGKPIDKPILLTDAVPDPKQAGMMWFASTGHTLRGAFLDYWNKYGGLAQFGYPLTEEFFEPVGADNKLCKVQYFERNRFEYHPENAGTPYGVLLGTLGLDFRKADPPAAQQSGAQYFAETGHNLSGAFKQYWDTHGGVFVHGYPITELVQEKSPTDGRVYMMQYFERSRLELHPENAGTPYEVLLGLLGTQLSEKKGYPYGWYPQYGYAVDYSWVSGRLIPSRMCFPAECSCPLFAYDQHDVIRPWGKGWTNAIDKDVAKSIYYLVLFGHRQSNAEQDPTCKPNFSVDKVQRNPSDTPLP